MNFVCIVFELGDKMLTLLSMENLIVQCNQEGCSLFLHTHMFWVLIKITSAMQF